MKTVTQFNYDPVLAMTKIDPNEKSVTVPDQAYSIQELIERHRQGILTDVNVFRDPIYLDTDDHDDVDMEKMRDGDLTEQEDYFRSTQETKPVEEEVEPKKEVKKGEEEKKVRSSKANTSREKRNVGATSGSDLDEGGEPEV